MRIFVARSRIAAPAEAVFDWHARPGALERLVPPWDRVEVLERAGGIEDGARVVLRVWMGPVPRRWVAVHRGYQGGRQFQDEQVEGPFARWLHTHRVEPEGKGALLQDRIEYTLPGGPIGAWLGGPYTDAMLRRTFAYRHAVIRGDLERHSLAEPPLHLGITGASGLVGSSLVPFLTAGGHRVSRFVRRAARAPDEIAWSPETGNLDASRLEGLDAVIHLSGASVAEGRWTASRKAAIRRSRIDSTRTLVRAITAARRPPRALVCASAVGIYGDRGDEVLDETSPPGSGFLADICREWEAAATPAAERGVRVIQLRIGMVLSAAGGALARMVLPFKLGAGGRIGGGRQWVSWIALDDLLGIVLRVLHDGDLAGPVNAVAPGAVTNAELTHTLAAVLGRPALLPLPEVAARVLFGEMGQALLLSSARVRAARLEAAGFPFRHPGLEEALRFELGRLTPEQLASVIGRSAGSA